MINLDELKKNIETEMIFELSKLGYGYVKIVEGCFDSTQMNKQLVVPEQHLDRIKRECVNEVIDFIKNR